MKPLFLDTETTDSDESARLVQLAYKEAGDTPMVNELFKPPVPISIEAMAVHHITNEMVANKPTFEASGYRERLNSLLLDHILVAHNAPFDIEIIEKEGVQVKSFIDTLRVARHVVDSPKHGMQYLRYFLNLNVKAQAHDAEGDVRVLESLFETLATLVRNRCRFALGQTVSDKMIELTRTPVLLKSPYFGPHKGEAFESILKSDKAYLETLLGSETQRPADEQNEDLIHTLRHHLK